MNYFIEKEIYKKVSQYSHDGFVHYLLIHHDEIRRIICQVAFKEEIIVSTEIVNSEVYGDFKTSKKYVLDIIAKDDKGNIYNIEMQCYSIDDEEMIRFQAYGFRVVDTEIRKGGKYSEAKSVRQIIINASTPIVGLNDYIHHFEMYDEEHGVSLPYSIYSITIVQLAYLHIKTSMSLFDKVMYLLKTGKKYDIISTEDIIQEVVDMHEKYIKSDEMILAIQRERDEFARKSRELRMKDQEERIKLSAKKLKQDKEDFKQEKENFKQDQEKFKQDEERLKQDQENFKQDQENFKQDQENFKQDQENFKQDQENFKIKQKEMESIQKEVLTKQKEVEEKEKLLYEMEKTITEQKKNQEKRMIAEYTVSKFSQDISAELENITDEKLELLMSKLFYLDSIEEIKRIICE